MFCKHCRRAMRRRNPKPTPRNPLTDDQVANLLASLQAGDIRQELKDAVTLVLNTGMRVGEIRDLRWSDVNAQDRRITICSRTLSQHVRHIPYNTVVSEMLEKRRCSSHASENVFGGSPLTFLREPRQLKKLGQRVIGRAVTFQDLRHTFFTMLLKNGVDFATLTAIGGWRSPAMALRLMPARPAQVRTAYDAAMKKARS